MNTRYRYPQPVNEDDFEDFCLVLMREVWNRPELERYGHRGERQHGVDIIDQSGLPPLRAVQCKHHAVGKTLPPSELKVEIDKALKFPDHIEEYYVLTTAKKGGESQDTVRGVNRLHREKGRFTVKLLTWDEIERLIDQSPAAKQFLGLNPSDSTVKAIQAAVAPIMTLAASTHSVVGFAHAELDEINACLDRGDPEEANTLANRLKRRAWVDLSPGQRWRLCTYWADAKLRLCLGSDASTLLLEALTYAPDLEDAVVNAIRALRMSDDSVGARQKAKEALEKFPKSAAVYGELIELAETTEIACSFLKMVPDDIRETVVILSAIAMRYDLPESEVAARQVVKKHPNDVSAWHALGRWLQDHEFAKISPVETGTVRAIERKGFEEAIQVFTKVIELAQRIGHRGLEVDALTRRSGAYGSLNDLVNAVLDAERAIELAPGNPQVLLDAARVAEARGDTEATVRHLQKAANIRASAQIQLFLGIALWNRKRPGDRDDAIRKLESAACQQGPYAEPALEMAVEGHLLHGNPEAAQTLVERAASNVDFVAVLGHQGRIAKVRGDVETAERLVTDAVARISENTSRQTKQLLSKYLMYFERFGDALPILQQLAVPGATDESGRRLVDCAMQVDRQDVVIEYCASAREAGVFDPFLLERELHLLERYNPTQAIELLQTISERNPKDHVARVHLAVIAIRENRLALLNEQVAFLPNVEEVEAFEGATVVGILKTIGRGEEAIDYAYNLLRRYFDDIHAHRAYRDVFLFVRREDPIPEYEEVVPGTAVELTENGQSTSHWFVIEDSKIVAKGVDNEIRTDSPLAHKLLGKRRGSEVNLNEVPGFGRPQTVNAIVSKTVFRLRDVMNKWQFRFPQYQEVFQQHLETFDGEPDIGPILEWIEARRRTTDEILKAYRNSPASIDALANACGINEVDVVWQLAHREMLPIRCCEGTVAEIHQAPREFEQASEVVIDLSVFASLTMLGRLDELKLLDRRLIISPTAMTTIRNLASSSKFPLGAAALVGAGWNGAELFDKTLVDGERRRLFFVDLIDFCEKNCSVAEASCVALLEPSNRKTLIELIGAAGLESIALASAPGRILLSDDGVAVFIARQFLTVPRIWTQLVFARLLELGKIPRSRFFDLSAKLIGAGYVFTQSSDEILIECGEKAGWNIHRWPLRQAIALLGDTSTNLDPALGMAAKLVRRAYLEHVVPEDRRKVLIAVLSALGTRADVKEADLNVLRRVIIEVFGRINVVLGGYAIGDFDAWRASRGVVIG